MKTKNIFISAEELIMYLRMLVLVSLMLLLLASGSYSQTTKASKKVQTFVQQDPRRTLRIGANNFILPSWLQAKRQDTTTTAGTYTIQLDTSILHQDRAHRYRDVEIIPFTIVSKDEENIERNVLKGNLFVKGRTISFTLNDSVHLNYKTWYVKPNNQVLYSAAGIIVTNLSLTRDSAVISANSQQPIAGSPIDIAVENANIGDLSAVLGYDSLGFSGLLNAKFLVSDFSKNMPAITGTATVGQLSFMQQSIGELKLTAQRADDEKISADLEILSDSMQASLTANYYLNDRPQQLEGLLEIKKLPAAMFPLLPRGVSTRASGNINGSVRLGGDFKKAEWKGELNVDSTRFMLHQSESPYTIQQQKIFIDYPFISFNQFTIKDSLENSLVINGTVTLQKSNTRKLDLKINARDFTIVNASRAIKNQLYGYAGVNAAVTVTGNTISPKVKGEIYLNEKTALAIVMPEKNIDKEASTSLVRFIDADTFALVRDKAFSPSTRPRVDTSKLLNYNLEILSDPRAALTIIMDPSTGDELLVNGKAHLNAAIDTAGSITISGIYKLDSGYYKMNYEYLNKQFTILPGSAITFNGGPTSAGLNIKGKYIANTSPMDLLGNEVGVIDRKLLKSFNRKIPFDVILNLKGSLKQPAIGFDIQLPPSEFISKDLNYTIENKLVQLRQDIPATNKQVFALLMLDRFVGEQGSDFFKGNGSARGFSEITTASVSQFLSSALDEIASDLFKGINVDLNLNSYKDLVNNRALKRDLGVDVLKSFLDDRLSITVGRTYGIESYDGSAKAAQQKGSRFLPDVTVNYKLTKDGKYKFRSYKKDPFEVILDGYVVETGLAFIVTIDLETYKSLFMKKENKTDQ